MQDKYSSYKANVLQKHLYQASFPQVRLQMSVPNTYKQSILMYKQEDK